jgi:hypothetical protein
MCEAEAEFSLVKWLIGSFAAEESEEQNSHTRSLPMTSPMAR